MFLEIVSIQTCVDINEKGAYTIFEKTASIEQAERQSTVHSVLSSSSSDGSGGSSAA